MADLPGALGILVTVVPAALFALAVAIGKYPSHTGTELFGFSSMLQ